MWGVSRYDPWPTIHIVPLPLFFASGWISVEFPLQAPTPRSSRRQKLEANWIVEDSYRHRSSTITNPYHVYSVGGVCPRRSTPRRVLLALQNSSLAPLDPCSRYVADLKCTVDSNLTNAYPRRRLFSPPPDHYLGLTAALSLFQDVALRTVLAAYCMITSTGNHSCRQYNVYSTLVL
ncbi:hypothetical protein ACRALDRAFT_205134 [Sodiomyces alcalophilus JCM 7366]|uniref:uncharacterized protein n=1 Tax=Sodiomyces alcalophilus JCM 7366 TaxID=591952 RepID=UPI0039B5C8DF